MGLVILLAPRPITASDVLTGFSCRQPSLDAWLMQMAWRAERERTARSYVVCDADSQRVIGYYCLSAFSVERDQIGGGSLARNAPTSVPAVLLGRLAVDQALQGCGLGASLLHDAVAVSEMVSARIGARALIVDAMDEKAVSFYRAYSFQTMPSDPLRLFHRL